MIISAQDNTKGVFSDVGRGMDRLSKASKQLRAAIAGIVSGLVVRELTQLVKANLGAGDVLAKTADKVGIAAESLQEMRYAAELTGVQTSTLDMAMQRLSRRVGEAARGKYGNVGVVGIDYLGLMSAKDARTEYERISYCAEQSKNMAKRLNMPVVILTQINRQSARDGKIEMHSAKGSGAVEASADYMLSLERNKQKEIIVGILKNRSGEANLQFVADLDVKILKFRGLEPYNEICHKNVSRGLERAGQKHRNWREMVSQ